MSQFFQIHPGNPQVRLVKQAVSIIRAGGVCVLPTECAYVLVCHLGDKAAVERIRLIRRLDEKHNYTLLCRDLSELSEYAKVGNSDYRLLKSHTPGEYTFILNATKEVPKRLLHPKKKTIGIRVSKSQIMQAILDELQEPLLSSSLILPEDTSPMSDPYEIRQLLESQVDLIIDGGYCGVESTTVVDLTGDDVSLIREGAGSIEKIF
jgi:tRNA threonylcarbamoyl adenosine modification protein (Sua5/YciO/YrdC/YwlC family)